jgi:hypothetical protein
MTLYHFTSRKHIPLIRAQGLTKGVIPWNLDKLDRVSMVGGWQWTTINGDFMQEWARPQPHSHLPFRRDEWRITIAIPPIALDRVVPWPLMARKYHPDSESFLNSFPGNHYWRLVSGQIPPAWFVEIVQNPNRESVINPSHN